MIPTDLHTLHILNAEFSHAMRIFSERTIVDHGIIGIIIDIHHRRIIDLDAHAFALFANQLSVLVNKLRILHSAQHHLPGKRTHAVHAHAQAVFGIDGKKNGCLGDILKMIDESRLGFRPSLEKTDTADIEPVDIVFHLFVYKK